MAGGRRPALGDRRRGYDRARQQRGASDRARRQRRAGDRAMARRSPATIHVPRCRRRSRGPSTSGAGAPTAVAGCNSPMRRSPRAPWAPC